MLSVPGVLEGVSMSPEIETLFSTKESSEINHQAVKDTHILLSLLTFAMSFWN
jgi:hypothetical protein